MIGLASGAAGVCISTLCWESIRSGWRWPALWALIQPMTSGSAEGQGTFWGVQLSHSEHEDAVYFQGPLSIVCSSSPSLKECDTMLQHQQFQWQIVFLPWNLSVKCRRVIKKNAKDLAKLRIAKFMVQGQWRWCGRVWWAEAHMILKVIRDIDVSKIPWCDVLFPAHSRHWYFMLQVKVVANASITKG